MVQHLRPQTGSKNNVVFPRKSKKRQNIISGTNMGKEPLGELRDKEPTNSPAQLPTEQTAEKFTVKEPQKSSDDRAPRHKNPQNRTDGGPTNPPGQLPTEQERILNQIDEKLKHIIEAENKPTCEKSRISFPGEISKIVTSSSAEAKKNKLSEGKLGILQNLDNKLQMWIEAKKSQTNIEINDVLNRLTEEINTLLERWYIQCFTEAVDEAIPKELTPATASYFGKSYALVNTLLRHNWRRKGIKRYMGSAGGANYQNDVDLIKNLDNAFSHAPAIPYPITVWRGTGVIVFGKISVDAGKLLSNPKQYEKKVFCEAGYMSTSYNRRHAEFFAKDGILLEIQVPAGKRAIAATQTTEYRENSETQLRHESEIVFPRGQKIQIESITQESTSFYNRCTKEKTEYIVAIVKGKLL